MANKIDLAQYLRDLSSDERAEALKAVDSFKRKREEEDYNAKRPRGDPIGFDGTFQLSKYQGVVDKNDMAMFRQLASFFFTPEESRVFGRLLYEKDLSTPELIQKLNFDKSDMDRITVAKEDPMWKNGVFPQFYDFVDTIAKFLNDIRGLESSLDTSNFIASERRKDLLTVDARPYDIVDLELQTPEYFTSKNAIWRRGQALTDTDVFDPWLRAHNVFVKTSDGISLTNPQAGYIRSRTPYELAVTEAIYYSHRMMGEMIALEQGLFRVRWTDAQKFDSTTSYESKDVAPGKGLKTDKIEEKRWINSFDGPVNLPQVDHNTGKCRIDPDRPMHIYFQPKYTKVENYPNPWLGLWISNYGSPSRGINEPVFQQGGDVKLQPHNHDGNGGPIGFNNWSVTGISVAGDEKHQMPQTRKDTLLPSSQYTPFYNNLTANFSGLWIKPTTVLNDKLGGLAFFPLTREDLTIDDGTGEASAFEEKIKLHAKRYKGKCQSLFAKQMALSEGLTDAFKDKIAFEPPLAMYPASTAVLPSVTNLADKGWPKWNFVEACQIHPQAVWDAMAKCKNHPIHVCPRLREAYVKSGANKYVKSRLEDCQRRVYNRYKQLVGTETSGTMFTSNSDGMVIYNENVNSCGPGQQSVFRDADGKVLTREQALVRGNDGKMYFREGVPPENVSCEQKVAVVEKPGTAIGFNEALNVQQIQAEGERRRQLTNESSYMPSVQMMDTSEQTVNINENTKIDSSSVQPLVPSVFTSLDKANSLDKASLANAPGFKALTQKHSGHELLKNAHATPYIDDHKRLIYQDERSGKFFVLTRKDGRMKRSVLEPSKVREFQAEFQALVYGDDF